MKFSSRKLMADDEQNVDMTPLIDMVFILLIFFIVTTVFVKESGLEIEKPQASTAEVLEKQSLFIALGADGRIFCAGTEFSLSSLRPFIAFQLQKKDIPVVIQADINSKSGRLVDLIDECKAAGAKSINLAAEQE